MQTRGPPSPPHWRPGAGGLLLPVADEDPAVPALPLPAAAPGEAVAPIAGLHLTLLSTAAMAPLVAALGPGTPPPALFWPRPPPPLQLGPLTLATAPPHPAKDPPGCATPRRTWHQPLLDQAAWAAWLGAALRAWAARWPALPWPAPEAGRLYHLSRFNNRGGDPARSIGEVWAG